MPNFLVIARDVPGERTELSPEEIQRVIERYHAWGMALAAQHRLVDVHKLRDGSGRVVRGAAGGMSVIDGPFAEGKEIVGGYWVIQADDLDDAVEALASHPHLQSKGALEIREIETLNLP
jgi:hypothetical protein